MRQHVLAPLAVMAIGVPVGLGFGPAPSLAAEEPAEAAEESPPPPEPEEVESIPLSEVSENASLTDSELRDVEAKAQALEEIVALESAIQEDREGLEARVATTQERISRTFQISELAEIEAAWQETANALAQRRGVLTERARGLQDSLSRLDELTERWSAVRTRAEDAEAPPAVTERIDATLASVDEVRVAVSARRDALLELLDEEIQLSEIVSDTLAGVRERRREARSGFLERDEPPVWVALAGIAVDRDEQERALRAIRDDLSRGAEYAEANWSLYLLQALLLVLLVACLIHLKSRMRVEPDLFTGPEGEIEPAAWVVTRPWASALVVSLILSTLFHPRPPLTMSRIEGAVLLLALVRLVPRMLEGTARTFFYVMATFYLVDRVRELLVVLPLFERLLFDVETLVAVYLLWRLIRPARIEGLAISARWLPAASLIMRIALVALLVAFGASILGYGTLARYLVGGVLSSGYAVVALVGGYRVIASLIHVLLNARFMDGVNMIRRHRQWLERRLIVSLRWILSILWIHYVLGEFDVREDLVEAASNILSARLEIGELSVSLGDVLILVSIMLASIYVARFLRFVLDEDVTPRLHLPRGVPYALSSTTQYLVLFLGFIAAVAAAGVDLSKFTILAGALGVGVGFGLQNVVNNFVSGMILLFERPVQTGDVIQMADLLGSVTRIGIRSSSVRTFEGAEVIVPNANLISDQVVNWTLSDRLRRIEIPIGVKYGSDPEQVIELLLEAARSSDRVIDDPAPTVFFFGFGESSLDFSLRAWTADFDDWIAVRSEILVLASRALADAGIQIPFPQRDLHLRSVDVGVGAALRGTEEG